MALKIALARHGAHVNNILTVHGVMEAARSANHLVEAIVEQSGEDIPLEFVVGCSPQPRAVQTALIYVAWLIDRGFRVTFLGHNAALDTARGVADICKGGHPCGAPKFGTGFIRWWRDQGDKLPGETENYASAEARASEYIRSVAAENADTFLVFVCHGGVVEPALEGLNAGEIGDLPSGAFVLLKEDEDPQQLNVDQVYDPNAAE